MSEFQSQTELFGRWWVPEQEHLGVPGTFSITEERGSVLHVTGALSDSSENYLAYPVIHGQTVDGSVITLHECWRAGGRWRGFSRGSGESINETIQVGSAYSGAHLSPREARFDVVQLGFDYLAEWAQSRLVGGPMSEESSDEERMTVSFFRPQPGGATLPNGTLTLQFGHREFGGVESYTHERPASLALDLTTPLSHDQVDVDVVFPLHCFLSLATDRVAWPLSIRLRVADLVDERSHRLWVRSLDRSLLRTQSNDNWSWRMMLFSIGTAPSPFEGLLPHWFDIWAKYRDAIVVYQSVVRSRSIPMQARFLLIAQALEIFHRRRFKNALLGPDTHKQRIRSVVDGAPEEWKKWVKRALAHSNEPTLRDRIQTLRVYGGRAFMSTVPESFAKKMADTRNYYTHWDERMKSKAAHGEQLHYLTEGATRLFQLCLLSELGMD